MKKETFFKILGMKPPEISLLVIENIFYKDCENFNPTPFGDFCRRNSKNCKVFLCPCYKDKSRGNKYGTCKIRR